MNTSHPFFNPSCPWGGTWYACGNGTKFTGCCAVSPCNNNGCFQGDLRPISFDILQYGNFPDQLCGGGSVGMIIDPTAQANVGKFYTCNSTNPTFMGCCASDPCQEDGCPVADLRAAYLSINVAEASQYDPDPPLESAQSSASTSTFGSATSTAVLSPASTEIPNHHSSSVGAVAGSAAGGAVLLLFLIACYVMRHRQKRAKQQQSCRLTNYHQVSDTTAASVSRAEYSPYLDDKQIQPPSYPTELSNPTARSPLPLIHGAGSREVAYVAYSHSPGDSPQDPMPYSSHYSPQPSPVWRTDQASGRQDIAVGLGFTSVDSSNEYAIAELDGSERSSNIDRHS